jgi:hypothetical protein
MIAPGYDPRGRPRNPSHARAADRRSLRAALCAAAACALVVACGKQESPRPAAPGASAASPARVLVVGTDAAYAPFESQNEKGEIVGFDIDIVKAVAQKAGLEVKFVNTPWEGIFNALKQGDRDLLVSSITITDERRQTMDFSAPYFDAHQLIAVRADSKVARFDDLKALKVGVQTGTTGDEAISKLQGKTSPTSSASRARRSPSRSSRPAASTRSSPTTASSSTTSRTTPAASSAPSTTRRSRPSSTASRCERATPSCSTS